MRWAIFLPVVMLTLVVQTTLARALIGIELSAGLLFPDFAAIVAVFVVLRLRNLADAMLAAWTLGFAVDLASAGSFGASAVGPMALGYVLAAWMIFSAGDAFFRERPLPQMALTGIYCLAAHAIWVSVQAMLGWSDVGWALYGHTMFQACLVAAYTAVVAPLVHWPLRRIDRLLIAAPSGRRSGR